MKKEDDVNQVVVAEDPIDEFWPRCAAHSVDAKHGGSTRSCSRICNTRSMIRSRACKKTAPSALAVRQRWKYTQARSGAKILPSMYIRFIRPWGATCRPGAQSMLH